MSNYGGSRYNRNIKRKTERIPGGVGDREPYLTVDEIPDPKSIKTEAEVVELNEDADMRAGLEMAAEDQHYPQNKTYTDPGPTLYDQQVQDAHHPTSSAYHNGNLTDLAELTDTRGTEIKSAAEALQDDLEAGDYRKNHKKAAAEEANFFKRMMALLHHRRKDRYKDNRG